MKNYLTQTLLTCIAVISLYTLIQIANLTVRQPSADLIALVVRATVDARPTKAPVIVEVPVTVEVTRIVNVPPQTEHPNHVDEALPTATPVPILKVTLTNESVAAPIPTEATGRISGDLAPPTVVAAVADPIVATLAETVQAAAVSCSAPSSRTYTLIPMEAADTHHPDNQHGDLNLALRGSQPSNAAKELVTYNGPVDVGAPQLAGLFADRRRATITSVHQVRDWRWDCGEHGCATDWLTQYDVTLMGAATTPGEAIFLPYRAAEIYGGGYVAVVLYAEETRLTVAYTRDGTVANGYAAHLENFCVDPNLLAQYRTGNAGGRHELPGLHNGEVVGVASSDEVSVAIRDRGTFMDPRSQQDWWH